MENSMKVPQKIKNRIAVWSSNFTSGYMKSVQKVSCHVIWKMGTFTEEDTRNIVHRTMMPQSPSKLAPWDLTRYSQSPSAALSYFLEFHCQSGIFSLSKMILVLGKARNHNVPNLGFRGLSCLVIWCFTKNLHEMWCMSCDVMMKLPITSCPELWPSESSK